MKYHPLTEKLLYHCLPCKVRERFDDLVDECIRQWLEDKAVMLYNGMPIAHSTPKDYEEHINSILELTSEQTLDKELTPMEMTKAIFKIQEELIELNRRRTP